MNDKSSFFTHKVVLIFLAAYSTTVPLPLNNKFSNLKGHVETYIKKHPKIIATIATAGSVLSICGVLYYLHWRHIKHSTPKAALAQIAYGFATREKTGRPDRKNEDALRIESSQEESIRVTTFCVCDGTGGPGVSNYVAQIIHSKIKHLFADPKEKSIENIVEAFKKLDFEIRDKLVSGKIPDGQAMHIPEENGTLTIYPPIPPQSPGDIVSGTTASVCVLVEEATKKPQLWSFNVGDSKTIVTNDSTIVFSSPEHSVTDETEGKRMEQFKNPHDPDITYKLNGERRSNLTASRLFGSWRHKATNEGDYPTSAVTAIPAINTFDLPEQATLIITSDGLLHTKTENDITNFVHTNIGNPPNQNSELVRSNALNNVAEKLIEETHRQEGSNYHDDKAVIIAQIRQSNQRPS